METRNCEVMSCTNLITAKSRTTRICDPCRKTLHEGLNARGIKGIQIFKFTKRLIESGLSAKEFVDSYQYHPKSKPSMANPCLECDDLLGVDQDGTHCTSEEKQDSCKKLHEYHIWLDSQRGHASACIHIPPKARKCPKCGSSNVSEREGCYWGCDDCGETFRTDGYNALLDFKQVIESKEMPKPVPVIEKPMLDYGVFLEKLESGTFTDEELYDYLVQHVGHDETGYFIDSDGFYFFSDHLRKMQKNQIKINEDLGKTIIIPLIQAIKVATDYTIKKGGLPSPSQDRIKQQITLIEETMNQRFDTLQKTISSKIEEQLKKSLPDLVKAEIAREIADRLFWGDKLKQQEIEEERTKKNRETKREMIQDT